MVIACLFVARLMRLFQVCLAQSEVEKGKISAVLNFHVTCGKKEEASYSSKVQVFCQFDYQELCLKMQGIYQI